MSRALSILRAAAVAAAVAVVPAAHAQSDHGGHGAAPGVTLSEASTAYMEAMDRMNADMDTMEMSGEPGVDFALMMIPHHQSAIDMAKAYLESGEGDPELTRLSEAVVAAQESEIAFLREWLARHGR